MSLNSTKYKEESQTWAYCIQPIPHLLSMMFSYAAQAGESGCSSKNDTPISQLFATRGSKGILPSKVMPNSSAKASAPPVVGGKMTDSPWQLGHTKPDMFSTKPKIGIFAFLQKSISLRTSCSATSWGVVIMTAPSMPLCFKKEANDKCSSDVPGGVSTNK